MSVKTPEQDRNEQLIRRLYYLAKATSKDTPQFVSLFADGSYFYDLAGGKKYYGSDIGLTVDVYAVGVFRRDGAVQVCQNAPPCWRCGWSGHRHHGDRGRGGCHGRDTSEYGRQ